MSKKHYRSIEREPSHAGEILKYGFVEEYGLHIETVAELLGIARGHLSRILNGHNTVTPEIAIRLEALTQTPASQWLAIQSAYDTYMLSQEKSFQKYKEALNTWRSNSLSMPPTERRNDSKTRKLVEAAATFAKQLSNKKVAIR